MMRLRLGVCFGSLLLIMTIGAGLLLIAGEQNEKYPALNPKSCTSIMVGKKASTDGSVMTAHSCDGNYRTWLTIEPAREFPNDTLRPVLWGTPHTEEPWDMRKVATKGNIPEVRKTYAYLNTGYPCMNEKQLAIGETTTVGRKELVNKDGLFLIEELQRIALQRCSTAREAIQLMGALAEEYGYGDLAECLTVADKKEVWHFEICGSGTSTPKPGALWVAQRIPDEHVGVSANIPRISDVDFNNPAFFMYSKDIRERAKTLGYWDGEVPFKFWKVVHDGKKPFAIREYYILSTLAPSLNLQFDADELPFSVKPDKKVSVRDVIAYYRQTYEGTEWDMTKELLVETLKRDEKGNVIDTVMEKSPLMHNWLSADMRNLLNALKPGVIERIRTIAVPQCAYSHVIQCRDWLPDEVGGVAWFSFDNPGQSPRFPIYAGATKLPAATAICGQLRYRPEAAVWAFRETNKLATLNWSKGRQYIEPAVAELEEIMFVETPLVELHAQELIKQGKTEEAKAILTSYSSSFFEIIAQRWRAMKAPLWELFSRGY
ncbi:MAG: C69 family dipeptidase [Bacteroidales bacterium]|nr:C69 family dipeptidase [Bacteroidales bacterium]MCL2133326.1 C69 family dipeptidase [Bacteroidales bacterium]